MKNIYLLFIALLFPFIIQAQQFSFQLYISDSLGNTDTLTLGYDANATDSIDAGFGEVNIINQAWDTALEVRTCPYGDWDFAMQFQPAFESKKQIMHFVPQAPYNPYHAQLSTPFLVEIHSANQRPYYLSWDSTLFADSSRANSGIYAISSAVVPWYGLSLSSVSHFTFQSDWFTDDSYYINNNDTIWVLFFRFISSNVVGINQSSQDNKPINLYPNPANDIINFDLNSMSQKSELLIFNSLGQIVRQINIDKGKQSIQVDIANLLNGVYFYKLIEESGKSTSGKFVKD